MRLTDLRECVLFYWERLIIIIYVNFKGVFLRRYCLRKEGVAIGGQGVLHREPGIIPGGGGFRQGRGWEGCGGGGRRGDGGCGRGCGEVGSQPLLPKTHESEAA